MGFLFAQVQGRTFGILETSGVPQKRQARVGEQPSGPLDLLKPKHFF